MCSRCCSNTVPTKHVRGMDGGDRHRRLHGQRPLVARPGLWSRDHLSRLMTQNFPALAAKNEHDMKWKKFLYKQLCEREGINACRAPSCEYCTDYLKCFGPED